MILMNTDEKDKDAKYKEWCARNAEFLGRYTAEMLNMHKEEFENIIDEYINKKIKEFLDKMTPEDWSDYYGDIYQDLEKLVEHKTQKKLNDMMLEDQYRGMILPFNGPRSNEYEWKGSRYKINYGF